MWGGNNLINYTKKYCCVLIYVKEHSKSNHVQFDSNDILGVPYSIYLGASSERGHVYCFA